jgi:hypothetical protein
MHRRLSADAVNWVDFELTAGETLIGFRGNGNRSGGSKEMLKLFDYKP